MPRIQPLDREVATGKSRELLDAVNAKYGMVPNLLATLALSPGPLGAYIAFGEAMGASILSAGFREQIALAVAGANSCEYCAAAHTAIAKGAGVTQEEAALNLAGQSADQKTQAAIDFAKAVVEKRGWVADEELIAVRDAGFTDAEILEIVAAVVINIFTNYTNHIAQTEIDFPKVQIPAGAGA